jgi:hypothetical protein
MEERPNHQLSAFFMTTSRLRVWWWWWRRSVMGGATIANHHISIITAFFATHIINPDIPVWFEYQASVS